MLDRAELTEVLDLHERTYRLLLWVSDRLKSGTLRFDEVHASVGAGEACRQWVALHRESFPPGARPEAAQVEPFAHLFHSYLTTSFTLVRSPPAILKSRCGCFCDWCTTVALADHLQVRKPGKRAARDAVALKRLTLEALAEEQGADSPTIDPRRIDALLEDPAHRPDLALATYARELVRRSRFASQGEGILVLWRELAWEDGRPRKGFRLEARAILAAEARLARSLGSAR